MTPSDVSVHIFNTRLSVEQHSFLPSDEDKLVCRSGADGPIARYPKHPKAG